VFCVFYTSRHINLEFVQNIKFSRNSVGAWQKTNQRLPATRARGTAVKLAETRIRRSTNPFCNRPILPSTFEFLIELYVSNEFHFVCHQEGDSEIILPVFSKGSVEFYVPPEFYRFSRFAMLTRLLGDPPNGRPFKHS
jgi:hypothetical protein